MEKKAFTLVELLVVISIIAMLTSIVLVSLRGVRTKARDARRMSDIRQISNAMEMAYADVSPECGGENAYPTSSSASGTTTLSSVLPRICPTSGTYLNPTPSDPTPGRSYIWVNNNGTCTFDNAPAGQWYCIYAVLESESAIFAASQRGVKKIATTTAPSNCNCGW